MKSSLEILFLQATVEFLQRDRYSQVHEIIWTVLNLSLVSLVYFFCVETLGTWCQQDALVLDASLIITSCLQTGTRSEDVEEYFRERQNVSVFRDVARIHGKIYLLQVSWERVQLATYSKRPQECINR